MPAEVGEELGMKVGRIVLPVILIFIGYKIFSKKKEDQENE